MEEKKRVELAHTIAKMLKIEHPWPCNLPKEIIVRLNTKKGWRIVLDERRKSYDLE